MPCSAFSFFSRRFLENDFLFRSSVCISEGAKAYVLCSGKFHRGNTNCNSLHTPIDKIRETNVHYSRRLSYYLKWRDVCDLSDGSRTKDHGDSLGEITKDA